MPRKRWILLSVLLIAALAVAWTGSRALQARDHLVAARAALTDARAALSAGALPQARASLAQAAGDARRARDLTSDPVWQSLAVLPYAGRSLRTAAGLAAAADDLTALALPPAVEAADVLDPDELRRSDGSVDLGLVRAAAAPLLSSAQQVSGVRARLEALPRELVVPQVRRARAELLAQVADLDTTARKGAQAAALAPGLLGEEGLQRYMVLVQQPGESRGTGGLPAAYAIVEARDGELDVVAQGSNGSLPPQRRRPQYASVVPPAFVDRWTSAGVFAFFNNINYSPDLPVVARLLDERWRSGGGQPLDGVVTLDPVSLEELLQGSGAVDVGEGRTVPADQVQEFLSLGQYQGVEDQGRRKELLQDVAERAVDRLLTGEGGATLAVENLGRALGSGHMRIASLRPELAAGLRDAGLDGGLPSGDAPVAYAVVNNLNGGKLESWLSRSVTYNADPCAGDRRRSEIVLTLDSAPPADVPAYVKYDVSGKDQQSLTTRLLTSVYVTRGATLVRAQLDGHELIIGRFEDDVPVLQQGEEAGRPVFDVMLDLEPGRGRVLRLVLDEPASFGEARVPEQPLVLPLERSVDVPTCS